MLEQYLSERDMLIPVWNAADVGAEEGRVGLLGSPTKVLNVNFVVLESAESKTFVADESGVAQLMQELVQEYVL